MKNLRPVDFESLKFYIIKNSVNGFIRSSKYYANAFILFIKKFESNLQLYING